MNNFNLRNFLTENKLTSNSKVLNEIELDPGGSIILIFIYDEIDQEFIDDDTMAGTLEQVGRVMIDDIPNLFSYDDDGELEGTLFVNEREGLGEITVSSEGGILGSVKLISPTFYGYNELRNDPNIIDTDQSIDHDVAVNVFSDGSEEVLTKTFD